MLKDETIWLTQKAMGNLFGAKGPRKNNLPFWRPIHPAWLIMYEWVIKTRRLPDMTYMP
jgi:hypothetical protein